ncbi:HET-domain-containing protein [Rhizodiscina lignyota]|uniref:HET-domain-containing protein n=1 Tax=Rhizodiscina lignyota TaxID=1504668 RepID=A0A9P4I4U7_9PEZI|nr:HET-domain-containing protein [Rhizodiscina lignyota]
MRLLERNADGELVFHEFVGEAPPYAILSHTWATDSNTEVSFQDVNAGTDKSKAGYRKIQFCAEQAAADDLRYFWIDTCCIDKSSSAELQEAINSMYNWYRNSSVCYVYLYDVLDNHSGLEEEDILGSARWFTRGWTLQELIAPRTVRFYTCGWHFVGTKLELRDRLMRITKIPAMLLAGSISSPEFYSVAHRMSWASGRETSRPEDMAYSLMGIFSVNMPMLYGEGDRAFRRLQEEIMKSSYDFSIFAWRYPYSDLTRGIAFASLEDNSNYQPFSMTNKGIQIEAHLVPLRIHAQQEIYAMSCASLSTVGILALLRPSHG